MRVHIADRHRRVVTRRTSRIAAAASTPVTVATTSQRHQRGSTGMMNSRGPNRLNTCTSPQPTSPPQAEPSSRAARPAGRIRAGSAARAAHGAQDADLAGTLDHTHGQYADAEGHRDADEHTDHLGGHALRAERVEQLAVGFPIQLSARNPFRRARRLATSSAWKISATVVSMSRRRAGRAAFACLRSR